MRLLTPRSNTVTEGRALTGEVSPKGLVTHVEEWSGEVAAIAQPATMHWIYDDDELLRPMTMPEMISMGYFIIGKGPN